MGENSQNVGTKKALHACQSSDDLMDLCYCTKNKLQEWNLDFFGFNQWCC